MIVATDRRLSLEDYLNYDDGTDTRYELVNGVLVEMGAESDLNVSIAMFLIVMFGRHIHHSRIKRGSEIVLPTATTNTRYPDLMVLTEAGATALKGQSRSMITLDMPAPALVIEIVSNSERNKISRDRDYIDKRTEYADRGIPEYWIIDPIAGLVFVLNLVDDIYQVNLFAGIQPIVSNTFPELGLTANQVLAAGN
jgi:Uma2 family endonuclease